jgi:hypothetical protein
MLKLRDIKNFIEEIGVRARLYKSISLEDDIRLTIPLIKKAKKNIKIVTGELDSAFYNNPNVLSAFETSLKTIEDCIEIIAGPIFAKNNMGIKTLLKNEKFKLYNLPYRESSHFIVVDRKHVRIEEYHAPKEDKRFAYLRYYMPSFGAELFTYFNKLKNKGKLIKTEAEFEKYI